VSGYGHHALLTGLQGRRQLGISPALPGKTAARFADGLSNPDRRSLKCAFEAIEQRVEAKKPLHLISPAMLDRAEHGDVPER
jgi:hypothetical protein